MPTKPGNRFPHPTTVDFTKALLLQYAQQVASLGLKQIEVCDKRERGLRAIIYASGRVFFHARYFFAHRSRHKKLGEFGVLTIEQARAAMLGNMANLAHRTFAKALSRTCPGEISI